MRLFRAGAGRGGWEERHGMVAGNGEWGMRMDVKGLYSIGGIVRGL